MPSVWMEGSAIDSTLRRRYRRPRTNNGIRGKRQMRNIGLLRWLVLPAGIVLGGLVVAHAVVSDSVRQACTPDALRLCSAFIPNADKVKICMLRKRSQLSRGCRLAMRGGPVRHPRRAYYRRTASHPITVQHRRVEHRRVEHRRVEHRRVGHRRVEHRRRTGRYRQPTHHFLFFSW
jgi:hypothetical protein